MDIFPSPTLSPTEIDIVAIALTDNAVKKYFHMLAYDIGRDIIQGARSKDQTAEEYLCIEAALKGQLAVLDTLLSMDRPESAPPQS